MYMEFKIKPTCMFVYVVYHGIWFGCSFDEFTRFCEQNYELHFFFPSEASVHSSIEIGNAVAKLIYCKTKN